MGFVDLLRSVYLSFLLQARSVAVQRVLPSQASKCRSHSAVHTSEHLRKTIQINLSARFRNGCVGRSNECGSGLLHLQRGRGLRGALK